MSLFRKTSTPTAPIPAPTGQGPAISFDKVPAGLQEVAKTAAHSLDKSGLTGQRAAVYLVLDHSGSMTGFYRDGSVQRLAEQALGLSANLDDDGTVPIVYFGTTAEHPVNADLDTYAGIVDRTHQRVGWGSTNYVAAMDAVVADYQANANTDYPALVIFQTDGSPDSQSYAERALREYSGLPVFWAFVGFGSNIKFLERLDDLRGRKVDNASFFHAQDPHRTSDSDLYDGITHEYAGWLSAATAAGIVR